MNEQPTVSPTATVRDEAPEKVMGPRLVLPKSGIRLENGHLVRHTKDDQVIGSHALRDITGLAVVKKLDFASLVIGLGVAGGAIAAKYYIPSTGWSWVVGCVLAVVAVLFTFGSWGIRLRIEADGAVANYNLFDQDEDCQGFHLSLVNEWKRVTKR